MDLLRMSDHGRVHQNEDGGMHATGRMLFPYLPTTEKEPNLAVHRHRSDPPDVRKTTRLTIARICLHQSSATSSSATTRHIPVMMKSTTKDIRAGRPTTLRVRQATATGVGRRRRVTARRLTHRHLRLRRHQAVTMAEEARVAHAAHPPLTTRRTTWSHTMHVRGSIRSTRPGKDHTWDHVASDPQYSPQLTPKVSGLTRPSSPMTAPPRLAHGCRTTATRWRFLEATPTSPSSTSR